MNEDLEKLFLRFNYSNERGFILNIPSLRDGEHLSVGFDNKRKEFNIHFTNDNINVSGAKRRDFLLVMSAFRFFLFFNRFEALCKYNFINLILSSKTNPGKLKKNKFIVNSYLTSGETEEKLIQKRKNGKYWKFRKNIDSNLITDSFKYLEEADLKNDKVILAYKFTKYHLSLQGFIYRFEHHNGLYFIPIKKYNRFARNMTIKIYNYLNTYPTEKNLPLRRLLYERLKHPYLKNQDGKK